MVDISTTIQIHFGEYIYCFSIYRWGGGMGVGGGEKVGIFSSPGKRGESSFNQTVAKNDVDQNFVSVGN